MATFTSPAKSNEQITLVAENGDSYLVGTSEEDTLVAKDETATVFINATKH